MSFIATAKAKAAKGNVTEAFKNEAGAIDLASIMVGIIVIGLIGGVIAATVFAVIPWAQDNAAKQQLDSVAAAQSAYIGLSADKAGGSQTTFGDKTDLKTDNLFDGTAVADLVIYKSGLGTVAHYNAAVKSSSGNWFKISDTATKPLPLGPTDAAGTGAGGTAHTAATLSDFAKVAAAV